MDEFVYLSYGLVLACFTVKRSAAQTETKEQDSPMRRHGGHQARFDEGGEPSLHTGDVEQSGTLPRHHIAVTDDEFIEMVVAACRRVPNAAAVNLGGSRARGDFRQDSDWDFAAYYRGEIDPAPFEDLGWPGRVFSPFEWGQAMYGGAVFDLNERHFDIHFRNLDVVDHWTREANEGRFDVYILGFHLVGIPTYMLPGELAGSWSLWGVLPRPGYPDALRKSAPPFWLGRANRNSTTPDIGLHRSTRSVVRGRWPRSSSRARRPGWPIEASGR